MRGSSVRLASVSIRDGGALGVLQRYCRCPLTAASFGILKICARLLCSTGEVSGRVKGSFILGQYGDGTSWYSLDIVVVGEKSGRWEVWPLWPIAKSGRAVDTFVGDVLLRCKLLSSSSDWSKAIGGGIGISLEKHSSNLAASSHSVELSWCRFCSEKTNILGCQNCPWAATLHAFTTVELSSSARSTSSRKHGIRF